MLRPFLMLLAIPCALPAVSFAGDAPYLPPIDQLMHDTMREDADPHNVDMVWWIPTDFWRVALSGPDVSPSQAQKMVDALAPYAMFAVVQGDVGPMGAINFKAANDVRSSLSLEPPSGPALHPLPDDKIGGDALLFAQMMKPVLGRMLGSMGEHLDFYFFDGVDRKGTPILDPRKDATFAIHLGEEPFVWHLPLESLFAPVECSKCGRELKGTWSYCPYDGTKVPK